MSIAPGTMIAQYRVLSQIGEGGMGAVFYAEHIVLGRPAAIKTLLPHVAVDAGLVERFINEARIAARMNHRNVVDVLDCGMFSAVNNSDAQWYIALEFLQGASLSKFIAEARKPIDYPTIVHIIGEAANGLHAAHERHQLVHRDIKPDNLFLIETEDDPLRVKILDFGIAKLRQPPGDFQTRTHSVMGTPAYAAPEQLRASKNVDARADVWALGVVAYEMITGARPWGAALSAWEIIAHHTSMREPPDPRVLRPDIPARLADVIARSMEPEPDRRWRSTRDFARALADAAPMPFSGSGMSILEKYAPELTRGSSHSLTAGRAPPPLVQISPAEIVTGGSYTPGASSDGHSVKAQRVLNSGTARLAGPDAKTISTFGTASGQAILVPRRRRRAWIVAAAMTCIVGVGAVGAAMYSRDSSERRSFVPQLPVRGISSSEPADAAASMSALAVLSDPEGAMIYVDEVPRGVAPLNLQLQPGAHVEIRAELPGHESVRRSVQVTTTPGTLRLELPKVPEAGVTLPKPRAVTPPAGSRDGGRSERRRPTGSADGSGSNNFSTNDVL